MNIYNNDGKTSYRSKSKCSYCRAEGHNATQCPRVAEDYAYFSQSPPVIPIGITKSTKTCGWYSNPKYWGEWYNNCMNAHAKQIAAQVKASNSRTGVSRAAPKCGFCGSVNHNRRNCSAMDSYTANAIQANRNWRRAFYKKFVEELGISEGALLNLKERQAYGSKQSAEYIGVVTAVNWDALSLFCASPTASGRYYYRDDAYRQLLVVTVQVGNETFGVYFGEDGLETTLTHKNLVKYSGDRYRWNAPQFVSVLSRSETPIGEEWIEEGHAKAMEFLTKKRSEAKLDQAKVTELINQWL